MTRVMSPAGAWKWAPAYDVTFCEGSGGYQMDVMGEAPALDRRAMLSLADEAEVQADAASRIIDRLCDVAGQFAAMAANQLQDDGVA
ncbi:hypothetical protein [Cupriavidus sp. USMAA2-4]|uniref:hypothetical protein n=1 Tax=Cupriavidus sp. USMAA2-4 TaxID=876364 RepID=UPI0018DB0069|nr:hypothetical protein [Cupriavidus sp. USMAA2-4]